MADLPAFKDPGAAKALGGADTGTTEAKVAFQKYIKGLDHDGDGNPDTYGGKGMALGEGGRAAMVYDMALVGGASPAEAQAAVAKTLVSHYGQDGAREVVAKARTNQQTGGGTEK